VGVFKIREPNRYLKSHLQKKDEEKNNRKMRGMRAKTKVENVPRTPSSVIKREPPYVSHLRFIPRNSPKLKRMKT
jgi:hypothetical protein